MEEGRKGQKGVENCMGQTPLLTTTTTTTTTTQHTRFLTPDIKPVYEEGGMGKKMGKGKGDFNVNINIYQRLEPMLVLTER